jgi:hypothetical protein
VGRAIAEVAFVLTNFPFGPFNRPDQPGPVPHIAYFVQAPKPLAEATS